MRKLKATLARTAELEDRRYDGTIRRRFSKYVRCFCTSGGSRQMTDSAGQILHLECVMHMCCDWSSTDHTTTEHTARFFPKRKPVKTKSRHPCVLPLPQIVCLALRITGTCGTRSSAQGNCSAKSLAGNVVDSSLSSLPGGGGSRQGVEAGGRGRWGPGGRGYFIHLTFTALLHGA